MDPADLGRALASRWRLLVVAALLGVIAGTAVGGPSSEARRGGDSGGFTLYRATTLLLPVGQRSPNLQSLQLLSSVGEVPKRVVAALDLKMPPQAVAARMTIRADKDTALLHISAESESPQEAANLANTFGRELIGYLADQHTARRQFEQNALNGQAERLQREIDDLDRRLAGVLPPEGGTTRAERDARIKQYGSVIQRKEQLETEAGTPPDIQVLQTAIPVLLTSPDQGGFSIRLTRPVRAGVGGLVGLLLGAALALGIERLKPRIWSTAAAEASFGLPVLAEIPVFRFSLRRGQRIAVSAAPRTPEAAAFRLLQSGLRVPMSANGNGDRSNGTGPRPRTVLVTSPHLAEGKTIVAANLVAALEESGARVVAVSADLRRPALQKFLKAPDRPGLVQVLRGDEGNVKSSLHPTCVPGVVCMPSGGIVENPAELLSRPRAGRVLAALRQIADVVVVDTTSLLDENDAVQLLSQVDAVLVVARAGRTGVDAARLSGEFLKRMHAPVVGVALVGGRRARRRRWPVRTAKMEPAPRPDRVRTRRAQPQREATLPQPGAALPRR